MSHVTQFFVLDPGSGHPVAVARYGDVSRWAAKEVIANEKLEQATSWDMWLANSPLTCLGHRAEERFTVADAYRQGARDALNIVRAAFEVPAIEGNG